MQRKSNKNKEVATTTGPQKPVWRKISRGTIYPFPKKLNKRVKPHETIQASEEEIAKFREHFELVTDGTGEFKVKNSTPSKKLHHSKKAPVQKEEHTLHPIGEGLWNVLSPSGKVMNDVEEGGLKREEAEALKASLDKETVEG